jgi:hypothetical protein
MGSAELDTFHLQLIIHSHIITYGNAATPEITEQMRDEIETMWNEPEVSLEFNGLVFIVIFRITSSFQPNIQPIEIYQNTNPGNNYFRVEEFAHGNISFVDGLGCNSGYFKLENLYKGSTTVAHEYGHSLGLDHPKHLDIRGEGIPGIMYPRGTLVDPPFQYDPAKPAGVTGGTMHPMYRRVKQQDIKHLKLQRLEFENNKAVVGEFTNVYHWNHAEIPPEEFTRPVISG